MLDLKPTHKVIKDYYAAMQGLRETGHIKEGAVAPHFANVLRHCANLNQALDLVEQFTFKRGKRSSARLDGALVDRETKILIYGVWEAKDEQDILDREIKKKFEEDEYPSDNILFQSPARLILFQQTVRVFDKSIKDDPAALVEGLNLFFSYQQPLYKEWSEAVEDFKGRVGEVGKELVAIIEQELAQSAGFKKEFSEFWELCQETINPNLSRAAVVEMLVQHLLTERLFRTIFDNPDFVRKNVIAKKLEEVVAALTARSFSRDQFLKRTDHFYNLIERNAATIHDYERKQTFLNVLYEKFFQGFAVKVADTHGIVYTPQEIVSFMVKSVDDILKAEFDKDLASQDVHILDPFVGTGNFIIQIIEQISPLKLAHKYLHELHCNEVLLLPYYIASMNIEHAFFEKMGEYEPFTGVCLVDTFEIIEAKQQTPIFVIIGNPPYNVGQINENDNNKNRKYPTVDTLVSQTYAKDSKATNKNALSDAYVKAFAWATERLKNQDDGIVAFVTNNGFLENLAFDGMRKHLAAEFDKIYILDLKGNVRKDSMRDGIPIGEKHTVFGLSAMVGICVIFLVKKRSLLSQASRTIGFSDVEIFYKTVDFRATRLEKFELLAQKESYLKLDYQQLKPDSKHNWLTEGLHDSFDSFLPMGTKAGKASKSEAEGVIFQVYSRGVATSRDVWAYNFNAEVLAANMQKTIGFYNMQIAKYQQTKDKPKDKKQLSSFVDDLVSYDNSQISWSHTLKLDLSKGHFADFSEEKIRHSLYRPFTKSFLFFDRIMNETVYRFLSIFPTPETEAENKVICSGGYGRKDFAVLMTNVIPDLNFYGDPQQSFPFYIYTEDGSHRQENITTWALNAYQTHYQDHTITKWAIFYYVYGLLHHQGYRDKYQTNLKRELPRLPYAPDFWAISQAGQQLADLHLNYEQQQPYELDDQIKGKLDWRVEKMRLNKEKTMLIYNDSLTLKGIPPQVFDYKLGNRSALEWVIDQYQIKTDKRSGITNDPNRPDESRYIFELVGKVITVSLKTVEIVEGINALDFE